MRKKSALWVCLTTLLLFTTATFHVGAPETKVYVDPKSSTAPNIGQTFKIKITVADVNDLTGFEFKLLWNRTLLNVTATSYSAPEPWTSPFWVPSAPTIPLNNTYNATHGLFWLGCLNLPLVPISGDFTLATLTFKVMDTGSCTLDLRDIELTNSEVNVIPHNAIDGEFTTFGRAAEPFPVETVAVVIVIAIFLVAALYFVKKRIL